MKIAMAQMRMSYSVQENLGNTASFGKSDFTRKIVTECSAEAREYWLYSKVSRQNSDAVLGGGAPQTQPGGVTFP